MHNQCNCWECLAQGALRCCFQGNCTLNATAGNAPTTGDAQRREAGLRLEAQRLAEMKRLKAEERRVSGRGAGPAKGAAEMAEAMRASRQKKERN